MPGEVSAFTLSGEASPPHEVGLCAFFLEHIRLLTYRQMFACKLATPMLWIMSCKDALVRCFDDRTTSIPPLQPQTRERIYAEVPRYSLHVAGRMPESPPYISM